MTAPRSCAPRTGERGHESDSSWLEAVVHEAFLQAIRANPADDGARLIYADWLEDNGDPERAELWDSVYLRKEEIDQLLSFVRDNAASPWVYPLFCKAPERALEQPGPNGGSLWTGRRRNRGAG
jgi:uncharacterized protein (TIGR02996 family)